MLGAILGYFGGLFWHMYLFSLISIWHNSDYHQYFFLTSCPHLQWFILEYFGTYFGILSLLFGNRSICSVKFCTDVLDVPFERHCTIFFPYRDPAGEPQGSIFRLILGNVYLILHNCSIFSHEIQCRCSCYNPDGDYTQKTFYIMPFHLLGGILGYFGTYFCICTYFFQISVQHFLMKFCTGVLGITLIITNTKIFFDIMFQGDILGYSGAYFGILRLLFENRSIYSVKCYTDVLDVPFVGQCTIFFHIMTLLGSLRGYFRAHFGQCLSNTSNCSIFSHKTLHSCSWYNPHGDYTQKTFYIMPFHLLGGILGYFGTYFCICTYFFQISVQYFLIKCCAGFLV